MSQKTLFIVDDDADMIKLYERYIRPTMETAGIAVHTFFSPEEVLEAIAKDGAPDVLMTDDQMPYLSGRELAMQLRRQGFAGKILMVSGTADESVLQCGVDELRSKPCSTSVLRNTLVSLLG